jgi:hypothetical protein
MSPYSHQMSRKNGDISTQNQKKKERERKKGRDKIMEALFKKNSFSKKDTSV